MLNALDTRDLISNRKIMMVVQELCSSVENRDIAVVYGSAHLPSVERFLLNNWFTPVDGSEVG